MLEVFFTFIFVTAMFLVDSFWWRISLFLGFVLFVLPGVYAMIFGAPWLRTSDKRLEAMMKLADFSGEELVVDLGCGDGKIIRKIAARGVKKTVGYEFSIPTYLLAKFKSIFWGKGEVVKFGNFWNKNFSSADVLICFFLERTMEDFERKIWPKLKKGTRVISNEFVMKGIKHVASIERVYLYVKN